MSGLAALVPSDSHFENWISIRNAIKVLKIKNLQSPIPACRQAGSIKIIQQLSGLTSLVPSDSHFENWIIGLASNLQSPIFNLQSSISNQDYISIVQ